MESTLAEFDQKGGREKVVVEFGIPGLVFGVSLVGTGACRSLLGLDAERKMLVVLVRHIISLVVYSRIRSRPHYLQMLVILEMCA